MNLQKQYLLSLFFLGLAGAVLFGVTDDVKVVLGYVAGTVMFGLTTIFFDIERRRRTANAQYMDTMYFLTAIATKLGLTEDNIASAKADWRRMYRGVVDLIDSETSGALGIENERRGAGKWDGSHKK